MVAKSVASDKNRLALAYLLRETRFKYGQNLVKRLSAWEVESVTQVQILDFSLCANTLGKGIKPYVLLLRSYGKIVGQTGFFNLG